MDENVIILEGISKRYRIGRREPYLALRDILSEKISVLLRKFRGEGHGSNYEIEEKDERYVWALRGINLEVKEGEILGIIGRNGAGKTTLLKILSKITYPTEGKGIINGVVGSLLEVGIGFHPELTGRENIYLYGAILGMKKKEIDRKFDEIVAFSELEKFIDTPVKYYSSGMYVRLAFSVAAHLDTDILLVDEVLAVGDLSFQKKCFGKMEDITQDKKRTVLLVSHNMDAVMRICKSAIWLDRGVLKASGDVRDVVNKYIASFGDIPHERRWDEENSPGDDIARLRRIRLADKRGESRKMFRVDEPIYVEFEFEVLREVPVTAHFHLFNQMGVLVFSSGETHNPQKAYIPKKGKYKSICEIPADLLADGVYTIKAFLLGPRKFKDPEYHAEVPDALSFLVYDPLEGNSARGEFGAGYIGVILPKLSWETFPVD